MKKNYDSEKDIKFILEYDKKFELALKSLPSIENFLQKEIKKKCSPIEKLRIKDALDSIIRLKETQEPKYSYAFFFTFALAEKFSNIVEQIKNNQLSIQNMKNEEYWDKGDIEEHIAIFFSYSFFNELYGKALGIDMYKLMQHKNLYSEYWKTRTLLRQSF